MHCLTYLVVLTNLCPVFGVSTNVILDFKKWSEKQNVQVYPSTVNLSHTECIDYLELVVLFPEERLCSVQYSMMSSNIEMFHPGKLFGQGSVTFYGYWTIFLMFSFSTFSRLFHLTFYSSSLLSWRELCQLELSEVYSMSTAKSKTFVSPEFKRSVNCLTYNHVWLIIWPLINLRNRHDIN